MNNLVGLVRNEVGEMTNDLISQTQVSTKEMIGWNQISNLVFQVNKLSPEEEKKLKLEQEKRYGDSFFIIDAHFMIYWYFRDKTLQAYREQRQAKHEKTEEEREKFRDAIRQKYGIQRSATTGDSSATQKLKNEMTSDASKKEYHKAGAEEKRKRGMRRKQDSLQEGMKKLFIHWIHIAISHRNPTPAAAVPTSLLRYKWEGGQPRFLATLLSSLQHSQMFSRSGTMNPKSLKT